jgi:hypothetical protein
MDFQKSLQAKPNLLLDLNSKNNDQNDTNLPVDIIHKIKELDEYNYRICFNFTIHDKLIICKWKTVRIICQDFAITNNNHIIINRPFNTIIIHPIISSFENNCFSFNLMNKIILPNSITSLGQFCFSNCLNLSSIHLPNSLTSLSNYCFYNCSNLASISLPNSITYLGINCFSRCTKLTSVILPNSIPFLTFHCFSHCYNLFQPEFPNSLVTISEFCFDHTNIDPLLIKNQICRDFTYLPFFHDPNYFN